MITFILIATKQRINQYMKKEKIAQLYIALGA